MTSNHNEIVSDVVNGPVVQAGRIDQLVFQSAGTPVVRGVIEHDRIRVLSGADWSRTLESLYPDYPPVELFDWPVAAHTFPARPGECLSLETPLGELARAAIPAPDEWSPEFSPTAIPIFSSHLATVLPGRKWSGPTFALDQLRDTSDGWRMDCKPGRYFQSLATSEACDAELMTALIPNPDEPVNIDALPLRRWAHEHARGRDPVLSGVGRSAAASVSTVVMTARPGGGYGILLAPRSTEVATHRLFNHVAPSGIFAPLDTDLTPPEDEFSVRRTLLREYLEELYSVEEYEVGTKPIHAITSEPEIVRLDKLISSGDAALYYTGISVNLLTLRPEICTLLLIQDPHWIGRETEAADRSGRPWKMAWEWRARRDEHHLPPGRRHHFFLNLNENLEPMSPNDETLGPVALLPNAAAAIQLAIIVAKRITSE